MGEFEFVNDLCCNYLTIPYEGGEHDFELRMLTENAVDAFLAVELRRLDRQIFLYYNVSGTQNMEILYGEKPMERKVFQNFIRQLHEAIEASRELFLPGDGICLEPSALFWDLGTERWKFVYIPGRDKREGTEIQREREKIAEFLVMHMDYEDKELTETVYRFYEEICAGKIYPGFFTEKMMLEKSGDTEQEMETEKDGEEIQAGAWEFEEPDGEDADGEDADGKPEEKNTYGNRRLLFIVCGLLCTSAAVTLTAGRVRSDMFMAGAVVSVLSAALLFVVLIKRKNKSESAEYRPEDAVCMWPEENSCHIKNENKEEYEVKEYGEKEYPAEEKTVYMDIRKEQEKKLYGIGKNRHQNIFLDKLPCLVGKDKLLVDHIIADASVSRMHVRFFTEDETVWMQDLNSTNGTYHNGLRLNPNERVMLEPEDEIGLGKVQFVFR